MSGIPLFSKFMSQAVQEKRRRVQAGFGTATRCRDQRKMSAFSVDAKFAY